MNKLIWLNKIPGAIRFLDNFIRKYAEMRTAQEELIKTKREKEVLEAMLLKAVKEKYSVEQRSSNMDRVVQEAVRRAVHLSFEVVIENYYLVPKNPVRPNILGQTYNITHKGNGSNA